MMDELKKNTEELEKNWKIFSEIQYQKWVQVFDSLHLIQGGFYDEFTCVEEQNTNYGKIYDIADEMLSMWSKIVYKEEEIEDA